VAGIAGNVLTVLLLGWMATVLDYAKVRLVCNDARGSVMGLLRSFAFVFKHFGKTMGVWLMNAVAFAGVLALYLAASNAMHPTLAGAILLLVILQQAFILFRTAQRIAVWDSAMEIYEALKPVPVVAAAMESPVQHGDTAVETPVEHGDLAVDPALETAREPLESDGSGV
jgi:hypothetical protein